MTFTSNVIHATMLISLLPSLMNTLRGVFTVIRTVPSFFSEEKRIQKEIEVKGLEKFIEEEEKQYEPTEG